MIKKIDQIKEKIELKDMKINANVCKFFGDEYHQSGKYDCLTDCKAVGYLSTYSSDKY